MRTFMKIKKIVAFILYIACIVVGCYKFGYAGGLLVLAAWIAACMFCDDDYEDEDEDEDSQEDEHEQRPDQQKCAAGNFL